MKNNIEKLIKSLGLNLITYKTYRSDKGCQVYEVYVSNGLVNHLFSDSYFVGSGIGGEYILESLKNELKTNLL